VLLTKLILTLSKLLVLIEVLAHGRELKVELLFSKVLKGMGYLNFSVTPKFLLHLLREPKVNSVLLKQNCEFLQLL
jgi:hypothetical protein